MLNLLETPPSSPGTPIRRPIQNGTPDAPVRRVRIQGNLGLAPRGLNYAHANILDYNSEESDNDDSW